MPTLPPGRLTFGQIRRAGLAKAGNRAVIADANAWLSQLLLELYVNWAWPFLMTSTPIFLNGPTFTLPSDFLQIQDDNGFQINLFDGQPVDPPLAHILETDPATFAAIRLPATVGGMPRRCVLDRGNGIGTLWPDPTGHAVNCTLRYKRLPVAETTPPPDATPTANDAIIPVYPYHLHLIQGLAVLVMEYEQHPGAPQARADWERQLQGIRMNAMPLRSQEQVIPLEPEIFGVPFTED